MILAFGSHRGKRESGRMAVPVPNAFVWRPAALPREGLPLGAVFLCWTCARQGSERPRAMSGRSLVAGSRRYEVVLFLAADSNCTMPRSPWDLRTSTRPWLWALASERGGARRASSGRQSGAQLCSTRSEDKVQSCACVCVCVCVCVCARGGWGAGVTRS